ADGVQRGQHGHVGVDGALVVELVAQRLGFVLRQPVAVVELPDQGRRLILLSRGRYDSTQARDQQCGRQGRGSDCHPASPWLRPGGSCVWPALPPRINRGFPERRLSVFPCGSARVVTVGRQSPEGPCPPVEAVAMV